VYHCLASVVVDKDPAEAVRLYELAQLRADPAAEIYLGLDNAYMQTGNSAKRVQSLEAGLAKLPAAEELAHRLGLAYFDAGQYDQAVKCYQSHRFHVAEGQRDLHDHYAMALVGRAMTHLSAGRAKEALADLDSALEYPENLGIGKSDRAGSSATVNFWRGVALGQLNRPDDAAKAWQEIGGQLRLGGRRGPRGLEPALDAVHQVAMLRRQGQTEQAKQASDRILDMCDRQDSFDSSDKGATCLIRGFLAGVNGQSDECTAKLEQAQASPRVAGNIRLVRTWLALLK
jgi:tetratricopeptide (TPR) repeat protein